MVFVMRLHSYRHIPVYMPIGTRIPQFASASGRAVLSCASMETVDDRLKSATLEKHTPRTTVDKAALRRLVMEAKNNGYAYADEEFYHGDLNVAAAVLDEAQNAVAALSISVPKPRWLLEKARDQLGPLVVRAARAVGASKT
jgi:IclR family transcriptional regulator, pca regulon regulatory protein